MEAPGGFEPPHTGFANPSLNHLGMAPSLNAARLIVWRANVKPMMSTRGGAVLSLVVIAKNEADRIERCLSSVPFADDVVVLDSGSSDATVAVAERCGARVIHTDWPGHVVQKNRGLEACRGDWILSLDADEWLSAAAQHELEQAARTYRVLLERAVQLRDSR